MKKFRLLICSLLLIFMTLGFSKLEVKAISSNTYLEAKDYISLAANKDNTKEIADFLALCKRENKNAFFNSGTYILKENLELVADVSLYGDTQTVFKGENIDSSFQINILGNSTIRNIEIENIVFDNVTIYANGGVNWTIKENVFLNAKRVDINIDSGLKPDSSNKNGGELTGYYILLKNGSFTVSSNLFLRDEASKGRSVAIYHKKDVLINDNYFGLIEDIDQSIVSEVTKALKTKVLNLDSVDTTSNQGYFMTCINCISNDENVKIIGNHFALNKDIEEANYENGSGDTSGYNRDHIIYAKEHVNLEIVGNYFKGQNKNQDGGVKVRNGSGALIYRNVFEDAMLLFYVQSGSSKNFLKDTYVAENIFLNQDYIPTRLSLMPGALAKYPTQSFLIYYQNYMRDTEFSNFTLENNTFVSTGLANEKFTLVRRAGDSSPTNLYVLNNKNYLGEEMSIDNAYSIINTGTKFVWEDLAEYATINVWELCNLAKSSYKIAAKKLVLEADEIYLNNNRYNNSELSLNREYNLLSVVNQDELINTDHQTTSDGPTTIKLASRRYAYSQFSIKDSYDINIANMAKFNINEYCDLIMFSNLDVVSYDSSLMQVEKGLDGIAITPYANGSLILNCGGFNITFNIIVPDEYISDFSIADITLDLGETKTILIEHNSANLVDFEFTYLNNYLNITNELQITAKACGTHSVMVHEKYSNITKTFKVIVNDNKEIDFIKEMELNETFRLPDLKNIKIIDYDSTKIKIEDNIVKVLSLGTHNLTLITDDVTLNYRLVVEDKKATTLDASNLTIKLGETQKLVINTNSTNISYTLIYDNNALTINNNMEVKGLQIGNHGVTIIENESGLIKNITINVTAS